MMCGEGCGKLAHLPIPATFPPPRTIHHHRAPCVIGFAEPDRHNCPRHVGLPLYYSCEPMKLAEL